MATPTSVHAADRGKKIGFNPEVQLLMDKSLKASHNFRSKQNLSDSVFPESSRVHRKLLPTQIS